MLAESNVSKFAIFIETKLTDWHHRGHVLTQSWKLELTKGVTVRRPCSQVFSTKLSDYMGPDPLLWSRIEHFKGTAPEKRIDHNNAHDHHHDDGPHHGHDNAHDHDPHHHHHHHHHHYHHGHDPDRGHGDDDEDHVRSCENKPKQARRHQFSEKGYGKFSIYIVFHA